MQITHGTGVWVSGAHRGDLAGHGAGYSNGMGPGLAGQGPNSGPRWAGC